jgi:LmbE family N-acetylglucosaminyl deacetylase
VEVQVHTGPVLAVFAHPDDAEICAGGTLAKWVAAGREVHLLVLTNGDRGSPDPWRDRADLAATRAAETEAAARMLGLTSARVLDVPDGELENATGIREAVIRRIRMVRAETVVSCDPTAWFFDERYYNHSDHRRAGEIALDAVFPGAGNPHYFAEHLSEGLDVREVHDVWLGWTNEPNHVEDVTGHFRPKMDALAAHVSQVEESIRFFEDELEREATEAGAKIGVEHAEEFRVLALD